MQRHPNKQEPYPLSIDEQRLLFSELAGHLAKMALFKVNTSLHVGILLIADIWINILVVVERGSLAVVKTACGAAA
jgi:hypothetical protein